MCVSESDRLPGLQLADIFLGGGQNDCNLYLATKHVFENFLGEIVSCSPLVAGLQLVHIPKWPKSS